MSLRHLSLRITEQKTITTVKYSDSLKSCGSYRLEALIIRIYVPLVLIRKVFVKHKVSFSGHVLAKLNGIAYIALQYEMGRQFEALIAFL